MLADTGDSELTKLLALFFSGTTPTDTGIRTLASYLRVDGLFNVNSTSIEAWKAVLGGLKDRQIAVRDATGKPATLKPADIKKRTESEASIMPPGLVNNLSVEDLAALLAYLESKK